MFSAATAKTIALSLAAIGGGFAIGLLALLLLGLPLSGDLPQDLPPAEQRVDITAVSEPSSTAATTTVARLLRPLNTPERPNDSPQTDALPDDQFIAALRSENRELRTLNQELQSQLAEIFNWIIKTYKGKYPLAENQITNLSLAALSQDFQLNGEMIEFMNLDSNEVTLINDIFYYGAGSLNELLDQQISVTEYDTGRVILHIPPFSENGSLLREDIYSAIETTLGPYRFDRFMDVSQDKLESSFYYFGDATRTIIFEPQYISDDQPLHWLIKDGWIINQPDQSKTIKATETTVVELPAQYSAYSDYLPPYLQTLEP
jgi:hypothetical protein